MRPSLLVFILSGLLGSLSAPAFAEGWTDETGKPVPDNEYRQSDAGFGAQLVFTRDIETFRKQWNASAQPPTMPVIDGVSRGSTGASGLVGVLILYGCKADSSGNCDVFAEFSLVGPNGQRIPAGGGGLWNIAPVAGQQMMGDAALTLDFQPEDLPGRYRVEANVVDRVSRRQLTVTRGFTLQ